MPSWPSASTRSSQPLPLAADLLELEPLDVELVAAIDPGEEAAIAVDRVVGEIGERQHQENAEPVPHRLAA